MGEDELELSPLTDMLILIDVCAGTLGSVLKV
jgi:hypothetical protein